MPSCCLFITSTLYRISANNMNIIYITMYSTFTVVTIVNEGYIRNTHMETGKYSQYNLLIL